jgi:hypothetical protein
VRIGPRVGKRIGGLIGPESSGIPGVTRDASGKYFPADSTEWDALLEAAGDAEGSPDALWLAQEASGNLATSIGAGTQLLVGSVTSGTRVYQSAIAGYSRKGITNTDGAVMSFGNNGSIGINMATTSAMSLSFIYRTDTVGGNDRIIVGMGGAIYANILSAWFDSSNQLRIDSGTTPGNAGTATYAVDEVFPMIVQHDITNSVQRIITNKEIITRAYAGLTNENGQYFYGTLGGVTIAPYGLAYGSLFRGAKAERTQAQIKTLLQTLDWSVAW